MKEKFDSNVESGIKKIPKELKEKITKREILEAEDIGLVSAVVLQHAAEKFLNNEGSAFEDFAIRNASALLDSIQEADFDKLPENIKNKIRLSAEVSKAVLKSHFGDKNVPYAKSESGYRRDISGPIIGIQTILNQNNFKDIDQRYIGLIMKELGDNFEGIWQHGIKNKWPSMTEDDQTSYYSKNASAYILKRG